MQKTSLRIPQAILEDARLVANQRGKKQAAILRQAMALGIVELKDARPKPKQERKNDRAD